MQFPSLRIEGSEVRAKVEARLRCDHPRKGPRKLIQRDGKPYFKIQCPDCGAALSTQLSHSLVPDIENCPMWNEELSRQHQTRWSRAYDEEKQRAIAERKALWSKTYDEYLQTPEWRERSKLVKERAGGLCEGCRKRNAIDAHHLHYDNVGHEFLFDLVAVCRECHDALHPNKHQRFPAGLELHLRSVEVWP